MQSEHPAGNPAGHKQTPDNKHFALRLIDHRERWQQLSLKHKIIVAVTALVVVVGGSALAYSLLSGTSDPTIDISKETIPPPKPTTVASPLTGVQVPPKLAKRPVTGIMIENSLAARPQSGLNDAGIVFEAIAEGGITRFIALFQEGKPTYVGPVRSLRPYYIDFAWPFQAGIAHVGGSPAALDQIRSGAYRDLDQFFNAGYYWRVSSRAAPHNMYTNFGKLDALNKSKGFTKSTFTPWPRKEDSKSDSPTATSISIHLSGPLYDSSYKYDKAHNVYLRSEGGRTHFASTAEHNVGSKQIHPKVVMALVMSRRIVDSAGHSDYVAKGSGRAFIFQDGTVTVGKWIKAGRGAQFTFVDSKGQEVKLNAGQTWVSIVSAPSDVRYTAPKPKTP